MIPAQIGEACVPLDELAPSSVRYVCVQGAFCNSATHTCDALPVVGETCTPWIARRRGNEQGYGCAEGATCVSRTRVCVAGPSEGEACNIAAASALGDGDGALCAPGLRCTGSSVNGDSYRCVRPTKHRGETGPCVRAVCEPDGDTIGDVGFTLACP